MKRDEKFDRKFMEDVVEWLGHRSSIPYDNRGQPFPRDVLGMLDSFRTVLWGQPEEITAMAASLSLFYDVLRALHSVMEDVQSPIETYMLLGLTLVSVEEADSVTLVSDGMHLSVRCEPCSKEVYIQPQARIGEYRVDFLVTWVGMRREMGRQAEAHLVVECNGYDYHERTKEQAKRDRQQDRDLQSAGFPVFRFTGTEIWEDAIGCADKCVRFLRNKVTERLKEFDAGEHREGLPF
jgi:very-short-patch-repair endonuclease